MIFPQNLNIFIGFTIALLVMIVIFNFIYFSLSIKRFRKIFDLKYSFLNMFPYELFSFKKDQINSLHFIFFIILELTYFLTSIYFVNQFMVINNTNFYCLFIGIVIALTVLFNLSINLVSPTHTKAHITITTFYFLLVFLVSALCALFFFNGAFLNGIKYIILGILFSIVALCEIIICLNPKLTNWAKLDKNEKGELIRPKIFILPFSEWLTYSLFNITMILLLVAMLIL